MADGVLKTNTLVALTKEVTEGTPVDPASGADFIQVLEDGLEVSPTKELVERTNLTVNIGTEAPRTGIKSVTGSFPVEYKASGVSGDAPDYGLLIESLLGGVRVVATDTTTGIGTTTSLNVTTHAYIVGDAIVIETAGEFHLAFIKTITDVDNVEFTPAAPNAIQSGVTISPATTYFPTNTDQPTFTGTVYWGDEIKEQFAGNRSQSMALESFTTGQIPSLNFSYEGLNFTRIDGSAAFTPSFDTNLPPVVLGAVLSASDGTCIKVNEFTMNVENTQSFLTTVCSLNGRVSSRFAARAINGTFNPYMDDTTTEWFDKFDVDTLFELTVTLGIPSTTTGETVAGSNIMIYLPNVLITEVPVSDVEGILVDTVSFVGTTGADGTSDDIFMGFS